MNWDDIERALQQTIHDRRVGAPVALRAHIRIPPGTTATREMLLAAMRCAHRLFAAPPSRVMVRGTWDRQATALVNHAGGATLSVSVEPADKPAPTIGLLLLGNHGVVNLEPAAWRPELIAGDTPSHENWMAALEESRATGKAVVLEN